jgi:hypothetical protein
MDADKMKSALDIAGIGIRKHFELLRKENEDILWSIGLGEETVSFFREFSFEEPVEIGQYWFDQLNCLKKNFDWEDDFKRAAAVNLLLVGSGINGDLIVLDCEDSQAGILFHDYFWEKKEENPRKYLVKMGCSLGEFYLNSASVPDYPIDAYEAAAYMGSEFTGYWSPEEDN